MPTDHAGPQRDWSPLREGVAVALWCSFLAACLGTLLCFAYIDPAVLGAADRTGAYTIGFFFFWFIGGVAAGMSIYLLRTGRPPRAGRGSTP
jgi:hypothetical protein